MIKEDIPYFYGVVVLGPSGAGKTTFCKGFSQLLNELQRPHIAINLDPANINGLDFFKINIRDLVEIDDVMKEFNLGPNAALVYCMNFLNINLWWLEEKLLHYKDHFLIFDFPGNLEYYEYSIGQIELYLNNEDITDLLKKLTSHKNEKLQVSFTAVEMFDSANLYSSNSYIAQCLMSLISQVNLELPYLSILNKIDLLKKLGEPPMSLQFYLEASDLNDMFNWDTDEKGKFEQKYESITKEIVDLLDTSNKVNFIPLYVESKELMVRVLLAIDHSNGFYYLENQKTDKYLQLKNMFICENEEVVTTESVMSLQTDLFGAQ